MNDYKVDQRRVNQKIYRLNPDRVLSASPVPILVENPLSPPGQNYSWSVQSYSPPISSLVSRREGGYSSKKLYQCGDVWYLKEFYDEHKEPFRFEYGPRPVQPKNFDVNSLGAWLRGDLQDGTVILTDSVKNVVEFTENSVNNPDEFAEHTPFTEEQKQQKRKINRAHAKESLRMLVNKNRLNYMWTFTFALELNERVPGLRFILPEELQRDRKEVEKVWNRRRKAISRYLEKQGVEFRYVKVLEKHLGHRVEETDSRKLNTYHIHLACDRPIDDNVLKKLWGYGICQVENFNTIREKGARSRDDEGRDRVTDPGIYMSKYMEKDFDDADLHGFRAYSPSTNLERPRPIRDETIIEKEIECAGAESFTVFDRTYDAEYTIYRIGEQPRPVKLTIRYRIFNFRVPPKSVEPVPDIAAGVSPT